MGGYTILDFGFWILKGLPVGSFRNSNLASLNPKGISDRVHQQKRSPTASPRG
jgi:hypothetical protein